MPTYPTNVEVLDNSVVNATMEEKITTLQTLYSLSIPAQTLQTHSTLRLNILLNKVITTPLPDNTLNCQVCEEDALPQAQSLREVAVLSPQPSNVEYRGSYGMIGIDNEDIEIYQYGYFSAMNVPDGTLFDNNPNYKLYRIRGNTYNEIAKILTTTTDQLDHEARFVNGISDIPVYAMSSLTTISSNSPDGFYMHFPIEGNQIFIDQRSDNFCVDNSEIYLTSSSGVAPTLAISRYNISGGLIDSSTIIYTLGYTDIRALHVKGNYIFVLANADLVILNRKNFSYVGTRVLNGNLIRAIYAVSETLIYFFWSNGGTWGISYLNLKNNTILDIDQSIPNSNQLSFLTGPVFHTRNVMQFKKVNFNAGYFYITEETGGKIVKIGPLVCA